MKVGIIGWRLGCLGSNFIKLSHGCFFRGEWLSGDQKPFERKILCRIRRRWFESEYLVGSRLAFGRGMFGCLLCHKFPQSEDIWYCTPCHHGSPKSTSEISIYFNNKWTHPSNTWACAKAKPTQLLLCLHLRLPFCTGTNRRRWLAWAFHCAVASEDATSGTSCRYTKFHGHSVFVVLSVRWYTGDLEVASRGPYSKPGGTTLSGAAGDSFPWAVGSLRWSRWQESGCWRGHRCHRWSRIIVHINQRDLVFGTLGKDTEDVGCWKFFGRVTWKEFPISK